MKKTILFATILLLLIIPLASADGQGGGGGGKVIPLTYTYEECNAVFDGAIENYREATEKANRVYGVLIILFIIFFIYGIVSLLIGLGMTIQQIKDKGFKIWWSDKWKKTGRKDETDREKKR